MIIKGIPHRHGVKLARYLVAGKRGEKAALWNLRGFAAEDIVDAFRSVHVMAKATKCLNAFLHVIVRNPDGEKLNREQWDHTAMRIERMLGLNNHPRAISFHIDTENGHEHMHAAWSRICVDTLKAKPLPFFKTRLKKLSRELEKQFGLTPVRNERESPIEFAPTRSEEQQALRLGIGIHEIRENIRGCLEGSDCGVSFRSSLAAKGLVLARGERRDYLVVDTEGGMHALGKRVLGISAAAIRLRLADLAAELVPTLKQARDLLREQRQVQSAVCNPTDPGPSVAISEPTAERRIGCRHTDNKWGRAVGKKWQHGTPLERPSPSMGHVSSDRDFEMSSFPAAYVDVEHRRSRVSEPAFGGQVPTPVGFERRRETTPVQAPSGFADSLKRQFRSLAKLITGRESPKPRPRRKREDVGGGFSAAAARLLLRFSEVPPIPSWNTAWEPFTWLRLWEYNDTASMNSHQDYSASPPNVTESPHP